MHPKAAQERNFNYEAYHRWKSNDSYAGRIPARHCKKTRSHRGQALDRPDSRKACGRDLHTQLYTSATKGRRLPRKRVDPQGNGGIGRQGSSAQIQGSYRKRRIHKNRAIYHLPCTQKALPRRSSADDLHARLRTLHQGNGSRKRLGGGCQDRDRIDRSCRHSPYSPPHNNCRSGILLR